jgi:hypothetical protein
MRRWLLQVKVDANNTNINYVVSDQPMIEEEWAKRCVTEH